MRTLQILSVRGNIVLTEDGQFLMGNPDEDTLVDVLTGEIFTVESSTTNYQRPAGDAGHRLTTTREGASPPRRKENIVKKNSFVVYTDIRNQTRLLTLEQTGALFLSMLDYAEGTQPEFSDPLVQMAFSCVQPRMDRDRTKYEEVCKAHREAGKKGGRPRKNQQTAQPTSEPIFLPQNQMDFPKADNGLVSSGHEYEHDFDTVQSPVSRPADLRDEPTETCDRDGCERDFQDVLVYAKRNGFTFTSKQRKRLRNFVNRTSFEYVIAAIDRAVFHQGRTATYVLRILDEWWSKGLTTTAALTAYLDRREGGESA